MEQDKLCWLAGIVDGEGCITITRQKPGAGGRKNWSYRLYIKIAMGHEETIRHIHDLTECGTVTVQRSAIYNTAWIWWAASRDAIRIIEALRPYLVTKALEADIALEWGKSPLADRGGSGGGQEVPAWILAIRQDLFERLRDAKPSARFRAAKKAAQVREEEAKETLQLIADRYEDVAEYVKDTE